MRFWYSPFCRNHLIFASVIRYYIMNINLNTVDDADIDDHEIKLSTTYLVLSTEVVRMLLGKSKGLGLIKQLY